HVRPAPSQPIVVVLCPQVWECYLLTMLGDVVSLRVKSLGLVGCLLSSGCGDRPADARPPDVPGTMDTLEQLVLGGHAVVGDEEISVKVCATPDGLCVLAEYSVNECFRYESL